MHPFLKHVHIFSLRYHHQMSIFKVDSGGLDTSPSPTRYYYNKDIKSTVTIATSIRSLNPDLAIVISSLIWFTDVTPLVSWLLLTWSSIT